MNLLSAAVRGVAAGCDYWHCTTGLREICTGMPAFCRIARTCGHKLFTSLCIQASHLWMNLWCMLVLSLVIRCRLPQPEDFFKGQAAHCTRLCKHELSVSQPSSVWLLRTTRVALRNRGERITLSTTTTGWPWKEIEVVSGAAHTYTRKENDKYLRHSWNNFVINFREMNL